MVWVSGETYLDLVVLELLFALIPPAACRLGAAQGELGIGKLLALGPVWVS